MFSFVTGNWRGRPLTSYRVVVDLIAAATTRSGLNVKPSSTRATTPQG